MSEHLAIDEQLETLFQQIEIERMQDVPILHNALDVKAVGFKIWCDYHCGVLITPWFMNLMLVPQSDDSIEPISEPVGETVAKIFPAGKFEFIVGHETSVGKYLMCSLFSPMFEFGDMETAILTAETVMTEIMSDRAGDEEDERDAEMRQIWAGELPADKVMARDDEAQNDESRDHNDRQEENSDPEDQHIVLSSKQYSRRELLSAFRPEGERSET